MNGVSALDDSSTLASVVTLGLGSLAGAWAYKEA
jgi:hypothetical protein